MTEEEKEAIDYLENQDNSVNWNYPTLQAILSVLNLIYKLQKELKEKTTILMAGADKVKQLEKENAELKEKIKEYEIGIVKE